MTGTIKCWAHEIRDPDCPKCASETTPSPATGELKACPFCGGEGLPHRVPTGWRVSCKNCDCQPRPGWPADTEPEAVEAWNTRASPGQDVERIADLQLALDYALGVLIHFEPGDSRAVSNEFVAAAAIQAGLTDRLDECRDILRQALTTQEDHRNGRP